MLLAVLVLHVALVLLFDVTGRKPSGKPDPNRDGSLPPRTNLRLIPVAPLPTSTTRPVDTSQARGVGSQREQAKTPSQPSTRLPAQPAVSTSSATDPAPDQIMLPPPVTTDSPSDRPWLLDTEATKRAIRESARLPHGEVPASPRLTPEARMTQTLGGDGRLVEQDLGNGRWRYWQNGKCTEAMETRASALFPEDKLPRPKLVSGCN